MGSFDQTLDTSGRNSPLPELLTKRTLMKMETGKLLKVIATDPGMYVDIPYLVRQNRHLLIEKTIEDDKSIFIILKLNPKDSNLRDRLTSFLIFYRSHAERWNDKKARRFNAIIFRYYASYACSILPLSIPVKISLIVDASFVTLFFTQSLLISSSSSTSSSVHG